ncbi:PadR family transcriptional regulator [Bittarella massiliensis (ex Durand et al. 2017)]|uniref:PadR family transcriptional regulator n=1 Tax=Bittarella massiliensis (ex Durand et al. 2017) TaxID=1720313 RepID=UPI001FB82DBB|nr:PadR family transcriptional regulator [Bittarella massiliensis (ex Durand et al. 2017)]
MAEIQPMSEAMYYALLALAEPGHGYAVMQRVHTLSGGRLEMGPGILYGLLARMKREGLISLTAEGPRRKVYALTPAGRRALLGEYRRLKQMVADGSGLEGYQ